MLRLRATGLEASRHGFGSKLQTRTFGLGGVLMSLAFGGFAGLAEKKQRPPRAFACALSQKHAHDVRRLFVFACPCAQQHALFY